MFAQNPAAALVNRAALISSAREKLFLKDLYLQGEESFKAASKALPSVFK